MTVENSAAFSARKRSLAAAAALVAGIGFSANAWADISIDVTKSGDGSLKVELVLADGKKLTAEAPTTSAESPATIAKNLAAAINKQKPGTATDPGSGTEFTVASDEVALDVGKNEGHPRAALDAKPGAPDVPFGIFGFAPSLFDGGTVLDSPAQITAGFSSGLTPVSFVEPAGADIASLASALVAALDAGGYTAELVSPTGVAVFGAGAVLPAEFLLEAVALGPDGLGVSIRAEAVPEPPPVLALGLGLLAVWGLRRAVTGQGGFARFRQRARGRHIPGGAPRMRARYSAASRS